MLVSRYFELHTLMTFNTTKVGRTGHIQDFRLVSRLDVYMSPFDFLHNIDPLTEFLTKLQNQTNLPILLCFSWLRIFPAVLKYRMVPITITARKAVFKNLAVMVLPVIWWELEVRCKPAQSLLKIDDSQNIDCCVNVKMETEVYVILNYSLLKASVFLIKQFAPLKKISDCVYSEFESNISVKTKN